MTKRPAEGRPTLPAGEPAALAALSISESLILTLVESGVLDPQAARRCLLDAAAGFDRGDAPRETCGRTAALIDALLLQIDAVAPQRRADDERVLHD
ncbi:MAG: hypothetical protein Kow00114_39620 [Kiloniellaceae bacterium]